MGPVFTLAQNLHLGKLNNQLQFHLLSNKIRNYSGMLIGRPIAILYFLARKITAEGAEERREFNRLFPLRVPLRTLRLNSRFGYSIPHVPVVPA